MRIASLADLHLGYRGPGRVVNGRSQRTVDVENALERAVDEIIRREPDLVTIAGDVFDTVTPPLASVRFFMEQVDRLVTFTQADVVIIGGNHESPRTAGVMSPNMLAMSKLATHYHRVWVEMEPRAVQLPGVSVHCFPCSYLSRPGVVVPEPHPDVLNVLLIHAAVRSSARPDAVSPMYAGADAYDVARAEGFDVVACGDFHEFRVLAGAEPETPEVLAGWADTHRITGDPVAYYSGSIERTSSNMWAEAAPKGFVMVDTDARTLEFVEVPTRPMFDLSMADLAIYDGSAGTVNAALEQIATQFPADALVRLVVEDFPHAERDGIDYNLVRALQQRCVHFKLDIRTAAAETLEFTDRRARGVHSLADDAGLFFADDEPAVRAAAFDALGLAIPQEVGA